MKSALFALGIFLLLFTQRVSAFIIPSVPDGYVNDYASVFTQDTKEALEKELSLFQASTTNEIVVVTIPSLDGDTVEHYATKLFDTWKIGDKQHDNGVLLLVAINDRTARIEVGYGLEGALPDALAKQILTNEVFPEFKEGNYSLGILQGVSAIAKATQGEYISTATAKDSSVGWLVLIVVGIQGLAFLASILARSKSWFAGGILGGAMGSLLTYFHVFSVSLIAGSGITFVLIIFGLVFDYIVSKTYQGSVVTGASIPWFAGGGRSTSGGSTFGGFGGGSSGGGGASGSW